MTLQDLKDKIDEIEASLPSNIEMDDIPLQYNITDMCDNLDINLYKYLDHFYVAIEIE